MTAPAALHADQEAALCLATDPAGPRILVITGSPGTGKTTLVRAIIEHFEVADRKVLLAAPTGKAALRLSQQTGRLAATIHRLLEPMPVVSRGAGDGPKFRFGRDAANPLEADVLVLDEVSMVDVSLAASVCRALPISSRLRRLVIVGDLDQLPAVGPGQVLGDLIASGKVPVARLTTIKRQNPGALLTAIHGIKEGRVPAIPNRAGDDLFIEEVLEDQRLSADSEPDARVVGAGLDEWASIPEGDEEGGGEASTTAPDSTSAIAERILDLALSRLPQALPRMFPDAFPADRPVDRLRDIQVITPTRDKGPLSAKALGERFQARLIPDDAPAVGKIRVGDKVIQLKNDYDLGICNGDIGFVQALVEDAERRKCFRVLFDAYPDRPVSIPTSGHALTLAYAVTCHKFQGSESPVVVIPLHRSFPGLLMTRNWIYTAISRARTLCVLVGDPEILARAVRRTNPTRRVTALAHMVRAAAETR